MGKQRNTYEILVVKASQYKLTLGTWKDYNMEILLLRNMLSSMLESTIKEDQQIQTLVYRYLQLVFLDLEFVIT